MEYRKLGNTDLELSVITYGSFAIGGTMWGGSEKKEAEESLKRLNTDYIDLLQLHWPDSIIAMLSGKFFNGNVLQSDDHRNEYFRKFDLEKVKTFLERITPIAHNKTVSLSQLILKWTTLQPGITIVLAGARNKEQAISNAQAVGISLSEEELNFVGEQLAELK